jgi:FkbM family methyltransferase
MINTIKTILKKILRTVYRSIPFKRPLILAIRSLGIEPLLPVRLKSYLVFEGPFIVPVDGQTFHMLNGYGREIESTIFWNGLYAFESNTLQWWQILAKRSQVILDIGANTGIYALMAKTLNPSAEVHAFEPISRVYSILTANIALNQAVHLTPPPIAVHCMALSDYSGEGQMFDLPVEHMYTASLNKDIHAERGNPMPACTEQVTVQRLDHFLNSHHCERLDLIKIDVESHEPAVLRGLGDWLIRCHPSMIVEIWNNSVGEAVEGALQGCEYLYFALTDKAPELRVNIRNDFPDRGYLNYLICTEPIARELGFATRPDIQE